MIVASAVAKRTPVRPARVPHLIHVIAPGGTFVGMKTKARRDLARSEVVAAVQLLAKKRHSEALARLASKIATVLRLIPQAEMSLER